MALLFDLNEAQQAQRALDESAARQAFDRVLHHARHLGGKPGLGLLAEYRRGIAAVESQLLAEQVLGDGNTRNAERLLADGKTSKREQRKRATRAKAVGQNDDLASKMASGEMSEEQVDVIADAADKTDEAAATDTELIDKVASVPPERGKAIIDDYLADRATADGVQSEHDRQRALRRASKFFAKKNGLDAISIEGDGVAIKAMWDAIQKRANELYLQDGGRDLPLSQHPRTNEQRKFDAVYDIICGTSVSAATTSGRPRIVVSLTIDKALGLDPAAVATQHGLGLIADSVLAEYAGYADIMAALFDRDGEPLWLGRLNRYASSTQMLALILRDNGCVLCGADHNQCQAHHVLPWNSPGKGKTDLDDLVLLCSRCHHQLHGDEHTIFRDTNGAWRTRPATADELPPSRPTTNRNQVRRE